MDTWLLVMFAVATVLVGILWLRLHAFLVLMLAGLIVAVGTTPETLRRHAEVLVENGKLLPSEVDAYVARLPPERLATAFGNTAGKIGILIALASIIGACLLESGGAARIVDRMLAMIGERRAPVALAASSFVLGIPVFYDTVFYLMVPLARWLRRRTGRDYVLFILAIMAGGSIAHSLVPPTPGPLQVAEIIGVDLLTMSLAGLAIGALSSTFSLGAAWTINRLVVVPLRDTNVEEGVDGNGAGRGTVDGEDLDGGARPALFVSGPPLVLALMPIVLPILLIAAQTGSELWMDQWVDRPEQFSSLAWGAFQTVQILGDKNVALGIGAAVALGLLYWAPESLNRRQVVSTALAGGGVIILITAAGGAFGAMLGEAGIAESMSGLSRAVPGLVLLPIAFGVTTAIRTLQGSATVAMITAAGILQGLAADPALPFHPVYLALAIGGGSKPVSWMNDSGFWIMCKMSGMTEGEGLRTITPLTIAMGLSTLFWTMLAVWLVPLR